MNEKIFREYDIRGIVGKDFDESLAYNLGRAYAQLVKKERAEDKPTVGVGYDCRLTSKALCAELIRGLREMGANVLLCGFGPTPQLYYSVFAKKLDGGIQITASHNPGDYNGFKMMIGARTLSGADIQELKRQIIEKSADRQVATSVGELSEFDAGAAYLAELIVRSKEQIGARKLKIVVDGGNGMGGPIGVALLRELGCEVIELYTEPDGSFPNHHPDPTELKNIVELRARVVTENADCGIAFDGDADRIGVVDEKGQPIYGDMLLLIYGRELVKEVPGATVIGDVKCSNLLFSALSQVGANAVMAKTGHSLIKAKIKELGAELAGEMSGHMFFAHRYYGFDDAIHAAARFVEILSKTDTPVSQFLADLPKAINTPEIRLDCPEEIKFEIVKKAQSAFSEFETSTIDGVRITFPHGWGLVRASNTQSALVMRFEAESEEQLAEYQSMVEGRIEGIQAELLG